MSDLIDVPDEQIEQIAGRLLATEWDWRVGGPERHTREHYCADCPLCRPDYGDNAKRIVRSVLAAALRVLRAQIEAETREQFGDPEIEYSIVRDDNGHRYGGYNAECRAPSCDCYLANEPTAIVGADHVEQREVYRTPWRRLVRGETNG